MSMFAGRKKKSSRLSRNFLHALAQVNQELWLVLSLFVIALVLNAVVDSGRMILGFYTLPTVFSAYSFGRRHAVLTAAASILLVITLVATSASRTHFFRASASAHLEAVTDFAIWGGLLLVTAYAMGTLHERQKREYKDLRRAYFGILMILQQFISNDKYTHNHSYRVAHYAAGIGGRMRLDSDTIDTISAAALLHDIGKLEISRELLYKASSLTQEEMTEMRGHVVKGATLLEPVGSSLGRIIPIVLAHHDRYDGSGYRPIEGEAIPLEARVIAVADAYDTLTSDRPYRRAVSPFEAKDLIVKGSGTNFDPSVVDAFVVAFSHGELELPESIAL